MSEIEVETNVRLVLFEDQLKKMYEAVKGKENYWVRLVVDSEAVETHEASIIAYLQGPDGEEEEILAD